MGKDEVLATDRSGCEQFEAVGDWSEWLAQGDAPERIDVLRRHLEGVAVRLGEIYSEAGTYSWTDSALPSARTAEEWESGA
jgi:hypothetical protein